jgi:ABC-type multidrug transport system fused ATPase/permease subunit
MTQVNASIPASMVFGAAVGLGIACASFRIAGQRGDAKASEQTREQTNHLASHSSIENAPIVTPSPVSGESVCGEPRVTSAIKGLPLPGSTRPVVGGASAILGDTTDVELVKMNLKESDVLEHLDRANGSGCALVVGVAGGTGSGKTTLAKAIRESLHFDSVSYISHDNYYKVTSP